LIILSIVDAVDAVPVHFVQFLLGYPVYLIAKPELMKLAGYNHNNPAGWFYSNSVGSNDMNAFTYQIVAILWIVGWVTFTMATFFVV